MPDRRDRDEPRCTQSSTENVEPWICPNIESVDPTRNMPRTDNEEPIATKSKMDIAEPNRAILLIANDEPSEKKSITESAAPKRA
jgi:hypothetical protein